MDVLTCIKERRSIRKFIEKKVPKNIIISILEYGRWAPSGVNYQPWLVKIVSNEELKQKISNHSKYGSIIRSASHNFIIFLDKSQGYNYTKNVQSIGAFFQTILLAIHALGLSGVWLGEPYNKKNELKQIFYNDDDPVEFMGIISLGYSDQKGSSKRKKLNDFIEWFE